MKVTPGIEAKQRLRSKPDNTRMWIVSNTLQPLYLGKNLYPSHETQWASGSV